MSNPEKKQSAAAAPAAKEPMRDLSVYVPEKHRKPGEIGFAVLLTLFGALGYYFALPMTHDSLAAPSVFPKLASIIIVILGIICVRNALKKEPPEEGSPNAFVFLLPRDVLVMLVMLIIYSIALPRIHFIPASYIFMVAGMIYLHRGKFIWQSFVLSAIAMVALVLVFRYVFLVILP